MLSFSGELFFQVLFLTNSQVHQNTVKHVIYNYLVIIKHITSVIINLAK